MANQDSLANNCFLRALRRQPTEYTPVWLMRQAGRYLPEYCATRANAGSFMALAKNPELACEVTLQPIDRYGLDAAILFSDILTIPDAMGLGLSFVPGQGPVFAHPVQSEDSVNALCVPDPNAELRYVIDAVKVIRQELRGRVPLIGFSGSPFTLACYMIEGRGSKDFRTVKTMLYSRPDLLQRILSVNASAVAVYLAAQVEAGAQAVQIFDTWGGMLADGAYQEFSLSPMRQVIENFRRYEHCRDIPIIVFTKGGGEWLDEISRCGCDAVGLDWTVNLSKARRIVEDRVALQGNLDPLVLFGSEETIRKEVRAVIDAYGDVGLGGHVFNLGHGINQFTPVESVQILVDEVHQYSRIRHS